jgi:hypothetical protein
MTNQLVLAPVPPESREAEPLGLTPAQSLLRKRVLDSVVSAHSKRNYARALDDLFALCQPTSLPGALVGAAGRHGALVAFDDQRPAIGHA